ncbi:DUF2690 domain-containing protein [Streptomyces mirabilis]
MSLSTDWLNNGRRTGRLRPPPEIPGGGRPCPLPGRTFLHEAENILTPAARPSPAPAPIPAGAAGVPGQAWRRHLFAVGAGVAAVAAAVVIATLSVRGPGTGQPTSLASPGLDPAPGCQGKACDGKDPDHMFCGLPGRVDSLGPQHRTGTGASVEFRYSKECAAASGRIWHSKVGDAIEVSAPGDRPRRVVIRNTADTGVYRFTPMVGGPDRTNLRLCFIPAGGTDRECFES